MLDYKFQLMLRKALMTKSCNRRGGLKPASLHALAILSLVYEVHQG
jgi:hypothetical protein